jgi:hypothetical protein
VGDILISAFFTSGTHLTVRIGGFSAYGGPTKGGHPPNPGSIPGSVTTKNSSYWMSFLYEPQLLVTFGYFRILQHNLSGQKSIKKCSHLMAEIIYKEMPGVNIHLSNQALFQ